MPKGKFLAAAAAAMTLSASAALGQTPPQPSATKPAPFTYLTAKDLAARVATPNPNGGATTSMIDNHEYFYSLVASRLADGGVERHEHWIDFITVLSGDVTLTVGGSITGNTVSDAGESSGGTQTGGTVITLHAGDYVQVPAGTAHRMTAPKNGFRYFVVKVRT